MNDSSTRPLIEEKDETKPILRKKTMSSMKKLEIFNEQSVN